MKNKNLTFQQFIKKLQKVDVGDLLEKAKGINVDDIKSMKFSDIKNITKSDYFYPSVGIFFASLTSIFFLFPSIDSLKNRQSKSAQYTLEKQELPLVDEELVRRETAKINIDNRIKNLVDLVPDKANLVLIPEILYDSSKRSGVEIVEFVPITYEDLNSCRSSSEDDFYNNDFQNDMSLDSFADDQNFYARVSKSGYLETKGSTIDRILKHDFLGEKDLHIWDYQIFWNHLRLDVKNKLKKKL